MMTAPTIDLISDFLLCASDYVMEHGNEGIATELRQMVVAPKELPDWATTLIDNFRDAHGITLNWSGSRLISPGSASDDADWDFYGVGSNAFFNEPPREWESSSHYADYMHCFRGFINRNNVNLILFDPTAEDVSYRFEVATKLCSALRVTKKQARIALFQLVLYGNANMIDGVLNSE